jgi:hypothetical protein
LDVKYYEFIDVTNGILKICKKSTFPALQMDVHSSEITWKTFESSEFMQNLKKV